MFYTKLNKFLHQDDVLMTLTLCYYTKLKSYVVDLHDVNLPHPSSQKKVGHVGLHILAHLLFGQYAGCLCRLVSLKVGWFVSRYAILPQLVEPKIRERVTLAHPWNPEEIRLQGTKFGQYLQIGRLF